MVDGGLIYDYVKINAEYRTWRKPLSSRWVCWWTTRGEYWCRSAVDAHQAAFGSFRAERSRSSQWSMRRAASSRKSSASRSKSGAPMMTIEHDYGDKKADSRTRSRCGRVRRADWKGDLWPGSSR